MKTVTISSNGETEELEIVSEPNGTYTIKPKVKPPANLSLKAAAIYTVHQAHRGERKAAAVQFKAPVPARLDGDGHARIDAAVAKRERKAAKRRGGR
jgi:hypothetical protein